MLFLIQASRRSLVTRYRLARVNRNRRNREVDTPLLYIYFANILTLMVRIASIYSLYIRLRQNSKGPTKKIPSSLRITRSSICMPNQSLKVDFH